MDSTSAPSENFIEETGVHPLRDHLVICRTGAAHERAHTICQDAAESRQLPGALLLALADGHGDPRHDLSHIGSKCAIESALDELEQCIEEGKKHPTVPVNQILQEDFTRFVARRWREKIATDAQSRLSSEEATPDSSPIRYGTTLLAAAIHQDGIFFAQIGDGDILLVSPEGEIETPIPAQTDGIGTVTASLCSSNAALCWQTARISTLVPGSWLIMSSDGLINSFADYPDYHTFCLSIIDRIKEFGLEKVTQSLPEWLNNCSINGSGDDISLCLVHISKNLFDEHLCELPTT